jgi:hypothetical protein
MVENADGRESIIITQCRLSPTGKRRVSGTACFASKRQDWRFRNLSTMENHVMDDDAVEAQLCYRCEEEERRKKDEGGKRKMSKWYYEEPRALIVAVAVAQQL